MIGKNFKAYRPFSWAVGAIAILCLGFASTNAYAAPLPAPLVQQIDTLVAAELALTKDPSASIAIVRDGEIAFAKAYGLARLAPDVPAATDMRFKIASNSKQFIATAILLLVEQKKLRLDDKVARFYPDLTRAKDISLRQLLTHTSGYQDDYAQDYLFLEIQADTSPDHVLESYAKRPLNFEPGSRYQYSNTGYTLLGRIVEKASGQRLFDFLQQHIFAKLSMTSVVDDDSGIWDAHDPQGHTRYAFGPVRAIKGEGRGWSFGAGQLVMTASDLARWNISLMKGAILSRASMQQFSQAQRLSDGTSTTYGLGIGVSQTANGGRRWAHSGGLAGFTSMNATYPDDRTAIVVLTNGEGGASKRIFAGLETLIIGTSVDGDAETQKLMARDLTAGLQRGTLDRQGLTPSLTAFFDDQAVADFSQSLAPLGAIKDFVQTTRLERGGMTYRVFKATTETKSFQVQCFFMPDGKMEQYLVRDLPPT
jgi:CubicO group peptidase (beta-lactamase class C family)